VANSKLETLNLINKLNNAYQCCKACGAKYGVYSVGCSSTWIGNCDVCGLENVSVTETRDYAYLYTGVTKLRQQLEAMKTSKEAKETSTEVKYSMKITSVEIAREDELVALYTTVSVEDEGGGPFITIRADSGEVRLDFDEFDEVIKAVNLLREQNG
jgi:hypothetical protein